MLFNDLIYFIDAIPGQWDKAGSESGPVQSCRVFSRSWLRPRKQLLLGSHLLATRTHKQAS